MTYSLFGERSAAAAFLHEPARVTLAWLRRRFAARKQRMVLNSLLEMDAHRLDDLGISRSDVLEALDIPHRRPGLQFHGRRSQRSHAWVRPE